LILLSHGNNDTPNLLLGGLVCGLVLGPLPSEVLWYLHLPKGEVIDPSQKFCFPYHGSSYDNPSFLIVSIIVEGPNYHHWSRLFQTSMISKNKIGFIDGTIKAPTHTNLLFPTW